VILVEPLAKEISNRSLPYPACGRGWDDTKIAWGASLSSRVPGRSAACDL